MAAPFCHQCGRKWQPRDASVHAREKAIVYEHPVTGERRVPPRSDCPMPMAYARQGFVRREIESMVSFERQTGLVHEPSNFARGNEPSPYRPDEQSKKAPKEVVEKLVTQVRDAAASGPWTGGLS